MGMRVEGSRPGRAPGPLHRNKAHLGPQAHVLLCTAPPQKWPLGLHGPTSFRWRCMSFLSGLF